MEESKWVADIMSRYSRLNEVNKARFLIKLDEIEGERRIELEQASEPCDRRTS